MARNGTLTHKQVRAVEQLLVCRTHVDAAAAAGISLRQLERWIADPDFKGAVAAASRERLESAIGQLRIAAREAIDTLRDALSDTHAANRIRAASVLLSSALETELVDLANRVAALEAAAQIGAR